ncbi:MAG: hypothetical protein IPM56_02885 [Ignavibacteriales bacterium]|nr:MAG: hypothetical protein IPM56_02885 [Ignavibacteriales bacterium]
MTIEILNTRILSVLSIVLLVSQFSIFAQYGSTGTIDTRSIGLARTSNAISQGVYSIGINPANLSIDQKSFIDFTTILPLPAVSLNSGTNFLTLNQFNYFFGGVNGEPRILTQADKDKFNTLIEDGGLVFMNASVSILSFSINVNDEVGAFAFAIQDIAGAKLYLPSGVTDVAFNGNPVGKRFNLDDSNAKAWWIRNYSLSYSRNVVHPITSTFDRFTVGTSIKLIHGYSYIGTERFGANFTTGSSHEISGSTNILGYSAFSDDFGVKYDFDSVSRKSSFSLFPSPAGIGYGFDFGLAATKDNWQFAFALTDLGQIVWNENTASFTTFGEVYFDDLSNDAQMDTLENRLTGESNKINEFTTSLPSALRLGVSYKFEKDAVPGQLLLGFDFNQGFNNFPGNTKYPRFAIGAEWKPIDWVPYIRAGFSYSYEFGFNMGMGIGVDIKIVELHLATSEVQTLVTPNHSKQLSLSFGSRWKIN